MDSRSSAFLDAVHESFVVFDGATGTNLQVLGLSADDFGGPAFEGCNELLCETRPDAIAELHRSFFEVGSQVVETNSFGSLPWVLSEYGIAGKAYELARRSAEIAREVAGGYGPGHWVAGSLGPGTKLVSLGHISFTEMRDGYQEAAAGLLAGGADLLMVETVYDLLAAKAGVIGCRRAMVAAGREVPLQVQVTIETTGRMLLGSEIGAALTTLDAMRPDVFGLNCATGPAEMGEHLRYLSAHCGVPISCLPNAGLPSVVDGKMHYDLTPEQLADYHYRFVTELGVRVVGGCCGTSPAHLDAVVRRLAGATPAKRQADFEPGCASLYTHVPYDQAPSVLNVGERTNANGSKKFREAMLAGDWDTCTAMAKEAVRAGSHVLDVCVDYTGADGVADMAEVSSRFATQSTLPLMLDSTESPVIECGLQRTTGKPIINSVNLEEGDAPGTRLDQFLTLAREYGAAVVCTCIDTQGQARTAEWKLRAASEIYDLAVNRYGIAPEDLFFDALVLPVSTGMEESRRDGIETIEGVRLIKQNLPGARTLLGISNVSFGLNPAARQALNSVFLHECQQAGLDAAIVNSARISPLDRIAPEAVKVCLDLIYDRRDPASGYDPLSELLRLYEGVASNVDDAEDRSGWEVERRLEQRVVDGAREGLEAELTEALGAGWAALDLVNGPLMAGMKTVGELFGSGRMQLPFVLQSAEVMKSAVAFLEPHMSKSDDRGKGRVVLATVKGDVHDIGKNLVDIILTNNGYEVYNLGIKVPLSEMVAKAEEVQADVIGMSGLLVKSTLIMRDNLLELNERGLERFPVILGGAALTRTYVERDLRSEYKGRLFYGKDAFEGLHTIDKLLDLARSGADEPDFGRALGGRAGVPRRHSGGPATPGITADKPARAPSVRSDNPVLTPPFLGARIERGLPLDDIAAYLNETSLFRNQWGYRPEGGENDGEFKTRIRSVLREQLAAARESDVLRPAVAYGYFPANADGDELVIWADERRSSEVTRFSFPRQGADPWLCVADFFRPVSSPETDYVAFHLVTMGAAASERAAELFSANRYSEYLHLHGLSVEMTEALAEYWHRRVREEWGFASEDGPTLTGLFRQQYRGGRYSWGYPACPDLEDNARCAWLLGADRLGVECSEETSWQFHPEQTTAAIICHHPQAKYFVVRKTLGAVTGEEVAGNNPPVVAGNN
ncbi:MAG TPA: methionine synthase [Acidimicrobiales bacterium]|nr:methionine synthase [Acidimicrobiales bacterium]